MMEENKRFYSQGAISLATYLGGPLAAGYLIKKNYETLEQPDYAKKALIIGIISTILLFAGIFSIPDEILDKIPNMLIPAIYTWIIYLIVERTQGKQLKEHKELNGAFYSFWKAAGIGAIAMVILLSGILMSVFVAESTAANPAGFDTSLYDKEINKYIKNEEVALAVFDVLETQTPEYLAQAFKSGIESWRENKKILNKINAIENLPPALFDQNELLLEYCDLRIEQCRIFIKAIKEDTNKYTAEIDKLGEEINEIIKELELLP